MFFKLRWKREWNMAMGIYEGTGSKKLFPHISIAVIYGIGTASAFLHLFNKNSKDWNWIELSWAELN